MPPGESIFTGIKVIDYRNGRYQGFFNSQTEKRHGMGILIDDDMNIYCSEWEDGRMSGLTFIYTNNGHYFYGMWKNNQPHGSNLYRNKEFILIGSYHRGANVGNTLAITDAINHMLVFHGEDIGAKDKKKDLQLISSENILEISLFQDIIFHTAAKNGIKISKNEASLLSFLRMFSQKHFQHIQLISKHGHYFYFGFKIGLGFKFTLQGKVNHKITMITIGSHEDEWLTDLGIKFHQSRCIEEGNFSMKETITYNRFSERPRDKCIAIFQKNHKKGLNFINEYFEYRSNFLLNLEWFLSARLNPKHQEDLKQEFQRRRLERQKGEENQRKQHLKSIQEEHKRTLPSRYDRSEYNPIQNRQPSRSVSRNKSISNFNKKPSKANFSPVKHQRSKLQYDPRKEDSIEYHQIREIQEQLHHNHFKIQITCERCRSKERKSQTKINLSKKSLERSKSSQKLNHQKSTKEIKYLVNYRPPPNKQDYHQRSSSKSFTELTKNTPQLNSKEKTRIENQIKIRKEIQQKQIQRDIKNSRSLAINYPLTFADFLGLNDSNKPLSANPQSFSPSSRVVKNSNAGLTSSPYDYRYPPELTSEYKYPNPLLGRGQMANSYDLLSVDSISKVQDINNRRDRILKEFKALNTSIIPQNRGERQRIYNEINPIHIEDPVLANYRQRLEEKDKISEFNKKYRNYLAPPENKPLQKNNAQNHQLSYKPTDHFAGNQPYVASFTFSPPRRESYTANVETGKSPASQESQLKDARKKKYEYFFAKDEK